MNQKPLYLESFDGAYLEPAEDPTHGAQDQAWLEVFEKGYRDGWDDALSAGRDEQTKSKEELVSKLADLSFTYAEAQVAVLKEVNPLFEALLHRLLPGMVGGLLFDTLLDHLRGLAKDKGTLNVLIKVSPFDYNMACDLIHLQDVLTINVLEDVRLERGQASLSFGESEDQIDIERSLERLRIIFDQYFASYLDYGKKSHG